MNYKQLKGNIMRELKTTINEIKDFFNDPDYFPKYEFSSKFHGYNSYEEMIHSFKNEIVLSGNDQNFETSNNLIQDVSGFLPIIPDYLQGRPDCMFNFDTQTQTQYHELELYISLSWKVHAREIKRNADILKQFIKEHFTPSDKFKISCTFSYSDSWEYNNRINKFGAASSTVILSDYNDYLTPELWNMICSPALFRFYMIEGNSIHFKGLIQKGIAVNSKIISYDRLPTYLKTKYIDFMNMKESLNNWKIRHNL